VRFRDLLRVSVLLFGGTATALTVVSVVGAGQEESNTLVYVAAAWWVGATVVGFWLGRRPMTTPGIATLLAEARKTNALPELEPGTVIFNRLWPLIVLGLGSAIVGFFLPQVPAIATGYCLGVALLWRHQSKAVEAIEGRDGVEFWLDRSSPFERPRLLRLPGLRKIDPV
jgi:hypothetical protein